jgi:hypothetical protein
MGNRGATIEQPPLGGVNMSTTVKQFKRPSPQPWKLQVNTHLDLFEEFEENDEPTVQFLVTEPDDFMAALEKDEEITEVFNVKQ